MLIVKAGGGKDINWDYICEDMARLVKKEKVILVHGASSKRDEIAKKMGFPIKYLTAPSGNGGVYTDKKRLEILVMVYAGLVNKEIVAKLQGLGVNAVGLSGADGGIWKGRRKRNLLAVEKGKTKLIRDTYTGKVEEVNSDFLRLLIREGYTLVVTQPAISFKGELINTDNDRAIAVMARELRVEKMVVLFEAPGLLRDFRDWSSLIKKISKEEIEEMKKYGDGRMKKKILGAKEALEMGVREIYWGDGRIKRPIFSALAGKGTVIL